MPRHAARSLIRAACIACVLAPLLGGCSFSIRTLLDLESEDPNIERAERALAHNADNAHAWFALGNAHLAGGDRGAARRAFSRAVDLEPGFTEAYIGAARAWEQEGRWQRALGWYDDLVRAVPTAPAGPAGRAACLLRLGDVPAARAAAARALAIDPDYALVHRTLGDADYMEGNHQGALEHWTRYMLLDGSERGLAAFVEDLRQYTERYGPANP